MTIYSLDVLLSLFGISPFSMSSSNCFFLTCIQISPEAGEVVWYSHLFQNFLQFIVIHTVKGFGIVNKAEIDVFLELSCFFDNPTDFGNLNSGSFAFSKTSLNIWKFTVHVLLKPGLENFEHWRRQWHPTPVLLPGKSHGRRSLVGCSPWGRTESDTTEATALSLFTFMHWRRQWQPTPVFLPGESQGRGTRLPRHREMRAFVSCMA